MKTLVYTAVFEPEESGGYTVHFPALPGCWTHGATLEEARAMAREAMELHLEGFLEKGISLPKEEVGAREIIKERVEVHLEVA